MVERDRYRNSVESEGWSNGAIGRVCISSGRPGEGR